MERLDMHKISGRCFQNYLFFHCSVFSTVAPAVPLCMLLRLDIQTIVSNSSWRKRLMCSSCVPRWDGDRGLCGRVKPRSKTTIALLLNVLYQLLHLFRAFAGKIFQISWRHSLAICLLLLGYRMQHLTPVLLGGSDWAGRAALDYATFAFFLICACAFPVCLFFSLDGGGEDYN